MKSLSQITLYDLMAENLDVFVSKNKSFGLNLDIDNEFGEALIREEGVHNFAADSFAEFCRSYLASYDKATDSN